MKSIKLNINDELLDRLQEIANSYGQSLEELFINIAKRKVKTFDTAMKAIEKVTDEEIAFLSFGARKLGISMPRGKPPLTFHYLRTSMKIIADI